MRNNIHFNIKTIEQKKLLVKLNRTETFKSLIQEKLISQVCLKIIYVVYNVCVVVGACSYLLYLSIILHVDMFSYESQYYVYLLCRSLYSAQRGRRKLFCYTSTETGMEVAVGQA